MFTRFGRLLFLVVLLGATANAAEQRTEVMVVATMHHLHAKSSTYSYDDLYALVRKVKPDYVGVEIRAEDLNADPAYLARNYPREMIETARTWAPNAFGFDWLGDEVAGAPVPADWWAKNSLVKKLEHELDADPAFQSKELEALDAARMAILAQATSASLNDGRYDASNDAFYELNRKLLNGSKYQAISDFYAERDRHIDENITAFIKAHPGKRIVILTGADHRSMLVRYLKMAFGNTVYLAPVP